MRIVGGRFGGRVIRGPSSHAIRPTSDRLRETIFNVLAHSYDDPVEGAEVIDLFAGAGGLGLEAMSRGARFALFVDDGSEARALLRANVETLGLGGSTKIFRRDATKLGQMPAREKFTLAFLDPPYGKGLAPRAIVSLRDGGWLAEGALVVVEEASDAAMEWPAGVELVERRDYGETSVWIARHGAPTPPP